MILDLLFSSGKCNSSLYYFCITAAAPKPMTVLRKLTDTEIDFHLMFYT